MHITLVDVRVLPEHIGDFIAASRENHRASVREPGNRRFDVMQRADNPACFLLYEAYADADSAAAHKTTAHYQRWRDAVAAWMAAPRQGTVYKGILPDA